MGTMEEVRLVRNGTRVCGVREPSWKTLSPLEGTQKYSGVKWSRKDIRDHEARLDSQSMPQGQQTLAVDVTTVSQRVRWDQVPIVACRFRGPGRRSVISPVSSWTTAGMWRLVRGPSFHSCPPATTVHRSFPLGSGAILVKEMGREDNFERCNIS